MPKNVLKYEQNHLNKTVTPLKKKQIDLQKELDSLVNQYNLGIKKVATDSLSLDEKMEDLGNLNKMMKSQEYRYKKDVLLKRLSDQINKPYFAKIKFKEKEHADLNSYYIGKYAHYDDNKKYHVIDWRSPLASIYYNNNEPTKNVSYTVNAYGTNKTFTGNLESRVNFDIDNSTILAIYDNSLRIDLLKLRISQKSGGKLTDIVETIQKTQNEVIRANPNSVCVVQGTAGSGKTTIAVHRLSYILYTNKDTMKESDTLLISSSKVLLNYVSSTLPELDVIKIDRFTLSDLFSQALIDSGFVTYKNSILSTKTKKGRVLNSWDFLNFLNKKVNTLKLSIIEDLEIEKFYDYLNLQSYFSRSYATPIFETLNYMLENLVNKHYILKKELKSGNFTVEKEVNMLQDALLEIRKTLRKNSLKKIYKNVLTEFYALNNIDLKVNTNYYDTDDFSVLYILGKLLFGSNYKNKVYKQIIIDEAQDLGILNFMAIKMLGEKSGFTILGDLNQNINNFGTIKEWEEIEPIFVKENINFFDIPVSYRTTKQVIKLAKSILQNFVQNKHLPEAFEREGEEPEFKKFNSKKEILNKIAAEVINKRKNGDLKAIGIIECDKKDFYATSTFLKDKIKDLEVVYNQFENFTDSATYLINPNLVKGLEFDTVYIIDPNSAIYKSTVTNSKRLFVLVTRAINTLKIYYANPLSKLLLQ